MQRKPQNHRHDAVYPVLEKIKAKLDGRLHVWANHLQSATKNYGKRKLVLLSSLLLSLYGCCCGYIIYHAFGGVTSQYTVTSISIPTGVNVHFPEKSSGGNSPERRRMKAFKNYLDSLDGCGAPRHDSIQEARPGLLDSLRMVENAYDALP